MTELSDEGINQLRNIVPASVIASQVSKTAIITFLVFFVIYFISRKSIP